MLKKVDRNWQFASENNLEDFVWSKLYSLFGLSPLKRQYTVYGDICDILALDENSRLVILELKNVEDRYIVQKLTRYYHRLQSKSLSSNKLTINFHSDL
jgi:RecB family endonuclease NucS